MSHDELPPDVEVQSIPLGDNRYRISVGIRNTIPHPTINYSSVSPMLNVTSDIRASDNEEFSDEVKRLYNLVLGPYMYLVVQQVALMTKIGKDGVGKVGLEILNVYHGEKAKA